MKQFYLNSISFLSMLCLCGCTPRQIGILQYIGIWAGIITVCLLIIGIIIGFICAGIRVIRGFFDF